MKRHWLVMLLLAPMLLFEMPSLARSFFDRPPILVMIHKPQLIEGLRNHATILVVVPEDVGNSLGAIVLRHLPNFDRRDWGPLEPRVYLGDDSLCGGGTRGLATATVSGP